MHGVRTRYFHSSFMLGVYIKTSGMQFTLQMCEMCLANSEDGIGEEKSLFLWGFFNMVLVRVHCFFMVVLASHL